MILAVGLTIIIMGGIIYLIGVHATNESIKYFKENM